MAALDSVSLFTFLKAFSRFSGKGIFGSKIGDETNWSTWRREGVSQVIGPPLGLDCARS
jgi:hypothetical protein